MKSLTNIQKGIYEIRNRILNNDNIRKMLFHDTANALTSSTPTKAEVDANVVVSPIFDATKEPFNVSTIVTVALNKGMKDTQEQMFSGTIKINVLTRSRLWGLNDNKIRPLEIANELIDNLDNFKLSPSHKIVFNSIDIAILNENINGYSVVFFMTEGSGEVENF